MATIAFIGGDGAGKTTIARKLEQHPKIRAQYLYMGLSTRSSNVSLPTSRLVVFIKRYLYRNKQQKMGKVPSADIPANELEYSNTKRNAVWIFARFLNRLAETFYRQGVSLVYQLRGFNVIYDRYYLYDIVPDLLNLNKNDKDEWDMYLLYWFMCHVFPKPKLVIFLDAPAEVLFARKGEASLEYLQKQRESFIAQGEKLRNFIRVDATQPLDVVQEQVTQSILKLLESTGSRRSKPALKQEKRA